MTETEEARVFCRYLIGLDPNEYVMQCYVRALPSTAAHFGSRSLIDRSLLGLARLGPLPARIADAYARLFRPTAPLRRRLILLLAILENSPPTAAPLSSGREGPVPVMALEAGLALLGGLACLAAGIVLLGPLHLLDWLTEGESQA
jgi:hypothetical protein